MMIDTLTAIIEDAMDNAYEKYNALYKARKYNNESIRSIATKMHLNCKLDSNLIAKRVIERSDSIQEMRECFKYDRIGDESIPEEVFYDVCDRVYDDQRWNVSAVANCRSMFIGLS